MAVIPGGERLTIAKLEVWRSGGTNIRARIDVCYANAEVHEFVHRQSYTPSKVMRETILGTLRAMIRIRPETVGLVPDNPKFWWDKSKWVIENAYGFRGYVVIGFKDQIDEEDF